ncbi:hypothetical protein COOONC_01748 [Cooperia oncophora]
MAENKDLDALVTVLNSVILTRATKGGARIVDIKKDYKDLCGSDIDTRKFGFDGLETLLKAFRHKETGGLVKPPKQLKALSNRWRQEKLKKGRPLRRPAHAIGPRPGFRPTPNRPNFGPPRGFVPGNQQQSSSKPFAPRNDMEFHQSASDGRLPRFDNAQQPRKLNKDEQAVLSKVGEGGGSTQVRPVFGFG